MFTRVLLPTDLSPSSAAALDLAHEHFAEARLCLLHVLEPQRVADVMSGELTPHERRESLATELRSQLEAAAGPEDETRMRMGGAVDVILAEAEAWRADLIIMGTHGRTGLAHFLNGSVAERVVRRAHCPVLITHEGAAQPPTDGAAGGEPAA